MKIVFMGTPAFAVPALEALVAAPEHSVAAVLCQPDRPVGRKAVIAPGPVKAFALSQGIPVFQPETLKLEHSKEIRAQLKALQADIFIVAAYGLILPKGILAMPPLGCVNIHGSLLPRYRGAAPVHAAIANGDTETGVTIMHMDAGMDTGDIILKSTMPIGADEGFESVYTRMGALGADALLQALAQMAAGTATRQKQDDAQATYAPQLTRADGRIDWARPAREIFDKIRAYRPWPGCFAMYGEETIKISLSTCVDSTQVESPAPGTILQSDNKLLVATGHGVLEILELQAMGSRRMPAADFLRGRRLEAGALLD
jgi:methionyl-tRNA formyltransferase